MALDRQSIEKRDFPTTPGGYDPDAVHQHLAQIAAEVEELRASRGRGETLASSASEQVRAIVEAAESSAAEIQRQATAQAKTVWQRLRAMESELSALLEGQPSVPETPTPPGLKAVPPEPEAAPPGPTAPAPESKEFDLAGGFRATGSTGASDPPPVTDDETEGARLIALNMALNGTSREETERYLSENFSLRDRAGLLDEVYSSVES